MKIKNETLNRIRARQKEKDRIYNQFLTVSLKINKDEMHRLKKALKENDVQKLRDWAYGLGLQLDNAISQQYYNYYVQKLEKDFTEMLDYYNIAIANVLADREEKEKLIDRMKKFLLKKNMMCKFLDESGGSCNEY